MTTLTAEAKADLVLLRRQTDEVRRAHHRAHRLASERQATVLRLRNCGVTYRVIAAAMETSVAAVQSILTRAATSTPAGAARTLGAGAAGGVGMGVGVSGGVAGAGAVGLGATITTSEEARA